MVLCYMLKFYSTCITKKTHTHTLKTKRKIIWKQPIHNILIINTEIRVLYSKNNVILNYKATKGHYIYNSEQQSVVRRYFNIIYYINNFHCIIKLPHVCVARTHRFKHYLYCLYFIITKYICRIYNNVIYNEICI